MPYVAQVGHFEITFCDALVVENVLVMSLKEKIGGNDVICQIVKLGYFWNVLTVTKLVSLV